MSRLLDNFIQVWLYTCILGILHLIHCACDRRVVFGDRGSSGDAIGGHTREQVIFGAGFSF